MRLPQAWWCENGRYGQALARVAIVEQNFPTVPAELQNSIVTPVRRFVVIYDTAAFPTLPAKRDSLERHGVAVAGVLASSGDNGAGVAGVIWKTDLRVFSLGTNSAYGMTATYFQDNVIPELIAAHPRILSLSSDFGPYSDGNKYSLETQGALQGMRDLLDSLPDVLIVKSAANDGVTGASSKIPTTKQSALQQALLVLLKERPSIAARIVHVGATTINGNRWSQSNELSGNLDLYAPGENIASIDPGGAPVTLSGTSFSTPMVAGIAGLLLAMDPSLTAKDVKDLLLAGARDSVENSNGDNVLPSPVGNTTDVVYEADAYGSLRRLSARAGRPLCGASVTINRDPNLASGAPAAPFSVLIRRYLGTTDESLAADGANAPMLHPATPSGVTVSVAPGGRTIAISAANPARGVSFSLLNSVWVAAGAFATTSAQTRGMLFGERDTLLITSSGVSIAGAAGTTAPVDVAQLVFPLAVSAGSLSLAADGSRFAFIARDTASSGTHDHQLWVVNRTGPTVHASLTSGADWLSQVRTGWTVYSRNVFAAVARPAGSLMESQLIRGTVGGTVSLSTGQVITGLTAPLVESITATDEGNRLWLRVSGVVPTQPIFPLDCALYSVRTRTLADPRLERQLFRESCNTSTVPPDDGGSCWYRGALPRNPAEGRAGSSSLPPGETRHACVNGAIP